MKNLENRNEKIDYSGKLQNYQINADKRTTNYNIDSYTAYQTHLYKRVLYGLKAFTQEELNVMSPMKKQRINNVYLRSQKVINLYKQKLTIAYSNLLFKTFFPNSPITDYLIENPDLDINYMNTLTFKELNIYKDDLIKVFISEGLLPKNFMEITTDPNALPKLRNQKI